MIYTIALNPAIDRTIWIRKIDYDDANRVEKECRFAGGKGIDVSKVLVDLGVMNRALGFVGGYAGVELERRLASEGVVNDFTHISEETRTNIIIHENATGRQVQINARGPEVTPYELGELMKKIEQLKDPKIVALGGSLPRGVGPEVYEHIIRTTKEKGSITVLDADGDALKCGIKGHPDYIKPNLQELGRLVGRKISGKDDALEAAKGILSMGIGTVLVSMGAKGMLMVDQHTALMAVPPKVDVVNTTGVGDASVAGFIFALEKGMGPEERLKHAVAAGTATTLRPGTARMSKEDLDGMLPRIIVEEMREVIP